MSKEARRAFDYVFYLDEYERVYQQYCGGGEQFSNLQSAYLACSEKKRCLGIKSGTCDVKRGTFELCIDAFDQTRLEHGKPRTKSCIYKKKQTHCK